MYIFRWSKHTVVPLLFLLSCGKALPTFEDVDLHAWKDDKFACSGQRSRMLQSIERQSEKLLSLDEREVIALLGNPDENELYKRNQKFYYYFVQPSRRCADSITTVPKKLVIRFNAVGLAKEVLVE